jgi:hypothetical protein
MFPQLPYGPNNMIDYSQYGDPMPFGPWSQEQVGDLSKSLTAGLDISSPGAVAGSGFALRPESLDGTLYNLSFRMEHLCLWPQLLKQDVWNTINEYNVLRQHGTGVAFFHNEGDLPAEDDSIWERLYARVKSMGCTRKYSLMAAMARLAHNMNAETHQTIGGTMWTLEQLEKNLFTGNATLLPQAFDGYDSLIANTRDLRGRPLTGDEVNYGAGLVFDKPNFGRATDLYMPVGVDTDFVEDIAPNARYNITPQGWQNGRAGMQVKVYDTQRGPISLNPDVFIEFGEEPSATALGDTAKRPGTPTESVALASAGSGSKFTAADAGNYRYKVVAVNEFGKSAPLEMTGAVTVAAGESVTFTIGDGNPVARYYEIHRSTKGGAATTCKYSFKIARDSSGSTVVTDTNAYIPGTARVYMVQQNREFNQFKRLMRFMKVRLGMMDANFRFMLLLFGNLVVQAPNKGLIYFNVGRRNRLPTYDA